MSTAFLVLFALSQAAVPPQDSGPALVPPTRAQTQTAPLLASDGEPATPGRIPQDTTPEARALWAKVLRSALSADGAKPVPVHSFDLGFDIVYRRPTKNQHNNFRARYVFSAKEGWIRCEVKRKKRVQLRGPDGDWLIQDGRKVSLKGRENLEAKREIGEWISIANNFIALTNPKSLRIVRLAKREAPPVPWPTAKAAKRASGLDWIEVASPDFRLFSSVKTGRAVPVFVAILGTNRKTGAVEQAILHEDDSGAMVLESTLLVTIEKWTDLDGYRVPENMLVYNPDLRPSPWVFEAKPGADMWLEKGGRLNPELSDEVFRPN